MVQLIFLPLSDVSWWKLASCQTSVWNKFLIPMYGAGAKTRLEGEAAPSPRQPSGHLWAGFFSVQGAKEGPDQGPFIGQALCWQNPRAWGSALPLTLTVWHLCNRLLMKPLLTQATAPSSPPSFPLGAPSACPIKTPQPQASSPAGAVPPA